MKMTYNQAVEYVFRLKEHPIFIMAVGVPGTGKSTWLTALNCAFPVSGRVFRQFTIASTDEFVDAEAKRLGISYTEAFKIINFKDAQDVFKQKIADTVRRGENLAIDQTNMTAKSRKSKLELIKSPTVNYFKIGMLFDLRKEVLQARLDFRAKWTGKFIHPTVIDDMYKSYDPLHKSEGFDKIIEIDYGSIVK